MAVAVARTVAIAVDEAVLIAESVAVEVALAVAVVVAVALAVAVAVALAIAVAVALAVAVPLQFWLKTSQARLEKPPCARRLPPDAPPCPARSCSASVTSPCAVLLSLYLRALHGAT